jgi:hypothetical protein
MEAAPAYSQRRVAHSLASPSNFTLVADISLTTILLRRDNAPKRSEKRETETAIRAHQAVLQETRTIGPRGGDRSPHGEHGAPRRWPDKECQEEQLETQEHLTKAEQCAFTTAFPVLEELNRIAEALIFRPDALRVRMKGLLNPVILGMMVFVVWKHRKDAEEFFCLRYGRNDHHASFGWAV